MPDDNNNTTKRLTLGQNNDTLVLLTFHLTAHILQHTLYQVVVAPPP